MGTSNLYQCEKCGFTIMDDDLHYFVDEETNCVVEHTFGRFTFNMGDGSKIKGRIIPSYCSDCSSEVHFYFTENESYVDEIKSAINQNEEEFKDILDEKYICRTVSSVLKGVIDSNDKTHSECPECGKKIPLILGDMCECPKCGGKMYNFICCDYD